MADYDTIGAELNEKVGSSRVAGYIDLEYKPGEFYRGFRRYSVLREVFIRTYKQTDFGVHESVVILTDDDARRIAGVTG